MMKGKMTFTSFEINEIEKLMTVSVRLFIEPVKTGGYAYSEIVEDKPNIETHYG